MRDDNDEFWSIAMEACSSPFMLDSDDDYDDDDSQRVVRYPLPNTQIILELQPLAATEGIWSPLGADAWYASALLTSLLLLETKGDNNDSISSMFQSDFDDCVVLELGSGAVGLSGLACAAALAKRPSASWKLVLTDNDPPVLDQLRRNVEKNRPKLIPLNDNDAFHQIVVEHLDWNDDCDIDSRIRLVIGSELVYTEETALACTKMLLRVLQNNTKVHIWIVQVRERFGWTEICIPKLESHSNILVRSIPIPLEIHDTASSMISMGGTLDRHAYGCYCICKKYG